MDGNISLGSYELSFENPPILLAEIAGFFGQDYELAKELVGQISKAGMSVPHQPMILKTEILHDVELCLPGNTVETYASKDGQVKHENYRELIARKVFPLEHYAGMFELCRENNLEYIVSVYDFIGVDFAVEVGASALKIASSNLVHVPLLRYCAKKSIPLIIDTGRSSLSEVHRAINIVQAEGCENIVLEHSPDGHPALPDAHNLRILQTYQTEFNLPVGLSDHHTGVEMLFMAIAMGARVVEKPVHVKPDEFDIDLSMCIGVAELPNLLEKIYHCWQALGAQTRDMGKPIEGVISTSQRQCIIAVRDLQPGELLSLETVRFAFPCQGISVADWDSVDGSKIRKFIESGTPLQWGDIQEPSS